MGVGPSSVVCSPFLVYHIECNKGDLDKVGPNDIGIARDWAMFGFVEMGSKAISC